MTDTIFCTCGQTTVRMEDVKAIQPLIIEHTAESSATWFTLGIVALICITIIIVAVIIERTINGKSEQKDISGKVNDLKEKITSLEGKVVEKDEVKKEYTSKLANFLEDLSKNNDNSKMKDIKDPACQQYLKMLTCVAQTGSLDKFNLENTEENDTKTQ